MAERVNPLTETLKLSDEIIAKSAAATSDQKDRYGRGRLKQDSQNLAQQGHNGWAERAEMTDQQALGRVLPPDGGC